MQSNVSSAHRCTSMPNEDDAGTNCDGLDTDISKSVYTNVQNVTVLWRKAIVIALFHLGAVYGVYLIITSAKIQTITFGEYKIQLTKPNYFKEFNIIRFHRKFCSFHSVFSIGTWNNSRCSSPLDTSSFQSNTTTTDSFNDIEYNCIPTFYRLLGS